MIDRRSLLRALGGHGLADWVLVERDQTLGIVDERTKLHRTEKRTRWLLTVHRDSPAGRGSAHVAIDALGSSADAIVEQAVALAGSSLGPAWLTQPLAAPARVRLEDLTIGKREPLDVAVELTKRLPRPTDMIATASVAREQVRVASRQGLRTEWNETLYRVELWLAGGGRSLLVERVARQREGLDVDRAIASAAEDLTALAAAAAPTAGPCAVVLGPDALLHGGLGVWGAFENQANAIVERQGLTRYREHAPIVPGADRIHEPLAIASDGALDYGVRSAPVGDEGEPVRRFMLVERGIAAGLGLSPREAALRGRDANGGVRNLIVAPGSWSGTGDPATRVVEVRRLRSLSIDPYTGEASLEIGLALDRGKPISGGSLRIDLIAALARARRSAAVVARGAYKGPQAVLIERAELIT